jgi:hypothetical protein
MYSVFFFKNYLITDEFLKNIKLKSYFNINNQVNNYLPVFYLDKFNHKLIITRFQKNFTPFFFKYFYYYIMNFFEKLTQQHVLLKIKSKIKAPNFLQFLFNQILKKHKYHQTRVGRGFFLVEMLEIL